VAKKKEPWLIWLESFDKAVRDATGQGIMFHVANTLAITH